MKLAEMLGNFFRAWQHAARAVWEYRIRFSTELNGWVIEKCETGNEQWVALYERLEDKPYAQIPRRFENYADARAWINTNGLDQAYQEVRYAQAPRLTPNQRALVESPEALARAMDQATSGTLVSSTRRLQPVTR